MKRLYTHKSNKKTKVIRYSALFMGVFLLGYVIGKEHIFQAFFIATLDALAHGFFGAAE